MGKIIVIILLINMFKIRRMAFYTAAFSVAGVFDACSQYE